VAGSGTSEPPPGPPVLEEQMAMVLVSIATAPLRARARPQSREAPESRVMLVRARRLPAKAVVVPRVAELPTCQKTFPLWASLMKLTAEALAVLRLLPI